ncbi:MAG: dephospho-CoA kinase [Oscillospiraceae bacterium]|nr:dephospho-CoA kinase [Oscillospiraceae bacterium]
MKIIGITGGTGAGKTTALEVLAGMGVRIIDCDAVYHGLLENSVPMREELFAAFGDILTDGKIDRKKLGKVVFGDPEKLEQLNKITHKYITAAVRLELKKEATSDDYAAAIDAIALIESGIGDLCDVVVGITAPESVRVQRLIAREGISEEYALMRIRAQKSEEWFRENCDHTLENGGSREQFRELCIEYFSKILDE